MGAISIPLSSDDEVALHRITAARHVSDAGGAAAELREYLHFKVEQIANIQAGIAAGDFATDEEVEALFAKYGGQDGCAAPPVSIQSLKAAEISVTPGTSIMAGRRCMMWPFW